MTDKWPSSEMELAAQVVKYLEGTGWDVYQEVSCYGGLCDIVAVKAEGKDKLVWIVETKLHLNLKVLAQAYARHECADYVSIAVPNRSTGTHDVFNYVLSTLTSQRMGLLTAYEPDSRVNYRTGKNRTVHGVCERLGPTRQDRTKWRQCLLDSLRPQHKTYAKAGGANGKHWSPFRETMELLKAYVEQQKQPVKLKDALGAIKHHYRTLGSGVRSVLMLMERDRRWNRDVVPVEAINPDTTEVYVKLRG